MPEFLKKKLEQEYPNNPHAVWGTLNAVGAVKGNKETPKGVAMDRKHAVKEAVMRRMRVPSVKE